MKDLNLVPKSYILQKKRKEKKLYYSIIGVIFAVFLAVFVTLPILIKQNHQYRFNMLDMYIKETNNYLEIEKEFKTLEGLCLQREEAAGNLAKMGTSMVTLMERVERCAPKRLFIMNFTVNSTNIGEVEVLLSGVSASQDEIASFVNHLRKDNYFSSVEITVVNRAVTNSVESSLLGLSRESSEEENKEESYNFEVKLNIKAGK